MPKARVVLFTAWSGEPLALTLSQAPPDMEVAVAASTLSEGEKARLCREADAVLCVPANLKAEALRGSRVRLVQTLSAGYDQLDVRGIAALGIPMANIGGANAPAVAEHTLGLMLALYRRLHLQWLSATRERRWRGDLVGTDFREIRGKTVGIIGFGRIGRRVAQCLLGFECAILYHDVIPAPLEVEMALRARRASLEDLLRAADIVTLHTPLTAQTRGLLGERALSLMKPTAVVINTSRGPVVDEKALYQALREGRIAGAGLDVLEVEPTPAENPLLSLPNVVVTPHMAGLTYEAVVEGARFAFDNVRRVLSGQPPLSPLLPEPA